MKPEQASKETLWTPTRLNFGEGCMQRGSNRQMHLLRSTGVMGTARRKGDAGNWGDPSKHEGRTLDAVSDGDAGGSRTGS